MPLVTQLPFVEPEIVTSYFADETGVVLLHSAGGPDKLARYSFLGVRPFQTILAKNNWIQLGQQRFKGDVFQCLRELIARWSLNPIADLPPFQGGALGYIGYDLNRQLERLPRPKADRMVFPDLIFGFYDVIFAWDHIAHTMHLFSSGLPYSGQMRLQQAKDRMTAIQAVLNRKNDHTPKRITCLSEIQSNFSESAYIKAVESAIEYIYAGDIFEVNLSQCFSAQAKLQPFDLYEQLIKYNPAPFAGFLQFEACQLISSSPERYINLYQGKIEACPIKGTIARSSDRQKDSENKKILQASQKDRAENIMIVDLMRNDLSRVSLPHSVMVPALCELQTFRTVHHLVSTVTATLAPQYDPIDLLKVSFPGGSITGAPKIRAMEIIATLEPTARGPYCGSMGYIGFDGSMDLSILIRTYCMKRDQITFQAGGAITALSDPKSEYEETLAKSRALKEVLSNDKISK